MQNAQLEFCPLTKFELIFFLKKTSSINYSFDSRLKLVLIPPLPLVIVNFYFQIFKKALDEPKYSSMYAQLCKRLSEEAPNLEPPDQPNTFKKLLLANCRKQFETRTQVSLLKKIFLSRIGNLTDCFFFFFKFQASDSYEQNEGPLSPDDEDRHLIAKRKMLGNIKVYLIFFFFLSNENLSFF